MGCLHIGLARYAFAQQTNRLAVSPEHVIGKAHAASGKDERLKRIEADISFQHLDCPRRLACHNPDVSETTVDEIRIEREGSLEFGDGSVVLALPKQDISKLSASLRQARVEVHRRLRQFKRAIERSGINVIAIERFEIPMDM